MLASFRAYHSIETTSTYKPFLTDASNMTTQMIPPPLSDPAQLSADLKNKGFAILSAAGVSELSGVNVEDLQKLAPSWEDLPTDEYLKDGGRYRRRRHGSFEITASEVVAMPHRAHWQPLSYNALHGGMQRWFAPMDHAVTEQSAWSSLMMFLAKVASDLQVPRTWYVEAHQFRIDTTDGIGRPTPEGAHRDGVNLVAVFLINRHGIKGGETRVFDMSSSFGQRFTLSEPWSLLLLNDERVIHETTPIQPVSDKGWRDTLVVTLRAHGFMDAPVTTQIVSSPEPDTAPVKV